MPIVTEIGVIEMKCFSSGKITFLHSSNFNVKGSCFHFTRSCLWRKVRIGKYAASVHEINEVCLSRELTLETSTGRLIAFDISMEDLLPIFGSLIIMFTRKDVNFGGVQDLFAVL